MTEKLLTKLLPHGANLTTNGIHTKPVISATDVAAALAYGSLPKHAYQLGLAKYCADKHAELTLSKHLERKIQRTINKNKWHDSEGRAKGLASLVIIECIHEIKCKNCNGRGFTGKYSRKNHWSYGKLCHSCNGTGAGRLSYTAQAKIAKLSTSSWTRSWRLRNEPFVQYTYGLEARIIKHLKHQLL